MKMRFKKRGWPYHQAKARCNQCGDVIVSYRGGDFRMCSCGKSFIDQERSGGLYSRMGGDAVFIESRCPDGCDVHNAEQLET